MRTCRFTIFLLPVIALAACETTGTSQGSGPQLPPLDSFTDYQDFGDALVDGTAGLGFTDPASLPTSGSATYDGVMGLVFDPAGANEITAIGTLEMQVQFSGDDIVGSVTNFIDDSNQSYRGSLTINNGEIDRGADLATQFTYFADVGGTITDSSGDDFTVDAILGGDLLGPGTYAEGAVEGFVTSSNGTDAVEGGYIGERRE